MQDILTAVAVLDAYQAWTTTTAVYPTLIAVEGSWVQGNPFYCGLKLCGEAEEVGKALALTGGADLAIAEMGDVCWYLSEITASIHLKLGTDIYQLGRERAGAGLPEGAILCSAARAGEALGKLWRDGYSAKQFMALKDALADTLYQVERQAHALKADLPQVLAANRRKLESRQQRGTLHGSGDDR